MIEKVKIESGIVSIGQHNAIALAECKWWQGKTYKELANFQMNVAELTMPFDIFHEAIEKTLGRPVYTHEFGFNPEGLRAELAGEQHRPCLREIIEMIPEDKGIIIIKEE